MNKTVIFISGWQVPQFLAKSKFVWDESLWQDYKTIWLDSRTPIHDFMIEYELDKLQDLVEAHPGCALVGQSLGGWWAANLALRMSCSIKKLALWTPVCDASAYPIFKASRKYHPPYRPVQRTKGPHRVLTLTARHDLIVPPDAHGRELSRHFDSMEYDLKGGHIWQSNHKAALIYLKDWIETQ